MATGASNADLAVMLVDARKGVLTADQAPQPYLLAARHPHVVLAVNKIDLVAESSRTCSDRIVADYLGFVAGAEFSHCRADPGVGALWRQCRDNVGATRRGIGGPSLLEHLETVEVAHN